MTRKYPLDPLKRVRAEKVDHRARSLADAIRKTEVTGAAALRATHAKEQHDQSVMAIAQGERERLERGDVTAADLAREAAWRHSAEQRRTEMARAVDQARSEHSRARSAEEQERESLATAQAESEVVARHHQKWRASRDGAEIARDEESAEEAHLGRPGRGGRG